MDTGNKKNKVGGNAWPISRKAAVKKRILLTSPMSMDINWKTLLCEPKIVNEGRVGELQGSGYKNHKVLRTPRAKNVPKTIERLRLTSGPISSQPQLLQYSRSSLKKFESRSCFWFLKYFSIWRHKDEYIYVDYPLFTLSVVLSIIFEFVNTKLIVLKIVICLKYRRAE